MKIANSILEFNNIRNTFEKESIGFVPTMGALHSGHLSLVKQSNNQCEHTIVSIFVNPKQFAPGEDFNSYPRTLQNDINQLESLDVDLLFVPSDNEIYDENYNEIKYDNDMFAILEGVTRPHFFKGVCNVVARLFDIVNPTEAFFGEKDFQQLRIIEDMAKDLYPNINIIPCKTIREPNGLAMSSRNKYLSAKNKSKAKIISQTLELGLELIYNGEKKISNIYDTLKEKILSEPDFSIDYIKIVNCNTLKEFPKGIQAEFIICIAVYIEGTRLIDNIYGYKNYK